MVCAEVISSHWGIFDYKIGLISLIAPVADRATKIPTLSIERAWGDELSQEIGAPFIKYFLWDAGLGLKIFRSQTANRKSLSLDIHGLIKVSLI